MVETEKSMMSTSCCKCVKQASGQSLQILADITIPSLFGRPLTPRSANLFEPPLCLPGLPPSSRCSNTLSRGVLRPFLKAAARQCRCSSRNICAAEKRAFNEALRQGVSKCGCGILELPGRGGCDASPCAKRVIWLIRYILAQRQML